MKNQEIITNSTDNLAKMLGISNSILHTTIKRLFPHKMVKDKPTYLTKEEGILVNEELKRAHNGKYQLNTTLPESVSTCTLDTIAKQPTGGSVDLDNNVGKNKHSIRSIARDLNLPVMTVSDTINKLFPRCTASRTPYMNAKVKLLSEEQCSLVKEQLRVAHCGNMSKRTNEQINVYSISELARMINIPRQTVSRTVNRLFPNLPTSGHPSGTPTLLSEEQAAVIIKALKETGRGKMATIPKADQPTSYSAGQIPALTIKQLSDSLDIPTRTIHNAVSKLFPNLASAGKVTYLDEMQVAKISKEVKRAINGKFSSMPELAQSSKLEEELKYFEAVKYMQEYSENRISTLEKENATKAIQIEDLTEKNHTWDTISKSGQAISMQELAKVLNIKDKDNRVIGQNRLFSILRNLGLLINKPGHKSHNTPYQSYLGYFRVVETNVNSAGYSFMKLKTLVTTKGIDFILKKVTKYLDI